MGNWSLTGIFLIAGLVLLISGFLFATINISNPLTGDTNTIMQWLIDLIIR